MRINLSSDGHFIGYWEVDPARPLCDEEQLEALQETLWNHDMTDLYTLIVDGKELGQDDMNKVPHEVGIEPGAILVVNKTQDRVPTPVQPPSPAPPRTLRLPLSYEGRPTGAVWTVRSNVPLASDAQIEGLQAAQASVGMTHLYALTVHGQTLHQADMQLLPEELGIDDGTVVDSYKLQDLAAPPAPKPAPTPAPAAPAQPQGQPQGQRFTGASLLSGCTEPVMGDAPAAGSRRAAAEVERAKIRKKPSQSRSPRRRKPAKHVSTFKNQLPSASPRRAASPPKRQPSALDRYALPPRSAVGAPVIRRPASAAGVPSRAPSLGAASEPASSVAPLVALPDGVLACPCCNRTVDAKGLPFTDGTLPPHLVRCVERRHGKNPRGWIPTEYRVTAVADDRSPSPQRTGVGKRAREVSNLVRRVNAIEYEERAPAASPLTMQAEVEEAAWARRRERGGAPSPSAALLSPYTLPNDSRAQGLPRDPPPQDDVEDDLAEVRRTNTYLCYPIGDGPDTPMAAPPGEGRPYLPLVPLGGGEPQEPGAGQAPFYAFDIGNAQSWQGDGLSHGEAGAEAATHNGGHPRRLQFFRGNAHADGWGGPRPPPPPDDAHDPDVRDVPSAASTLQSDAKHYVPKSLRGGGAPPGGAAAPQHPLRAAEERSVGSVPSVVHRLGDAGYESSNAGPVPRHLCIPQGPRLAAPP
eukprot:TRINITY_DN6539_c0_g1_i1.p1 TRINITY_DN6539_c0_g1~~TRINITY_DN6539_c0_g1_i1.p1  ORF type:complete len:694 (+),score=148.49 TRINITY_DN6539_c0_g1_i1:61-2142(+)